MRTSSMLALAGLVLAGPAGAQAPAAEAPASESPRFSMQPVEGGVLRLDGRTGQLSFCATGSGVWTCRLVPDERSAYEDEIARLNARIAALEKGGTARPQGRGVPDIMAPPEARPPKDKPPEATSPGPDAGEPTAPDDAQGQLDRAMEMAEQAFRRFLDMVDRLRTQPDTGKGSEKL